MGEEFQGGVCGGTWWNPPHNLFSSGLSSPCSVAQLGGGGGFDVGNFGWPNELVVKGINNNNKSSNNNSVFDNLIFSDQIDSSLDILGFGLLPTSLTTDWNIHQNLLCNNGSNEANFDSMLQDNMNSSRICSYDDMGVINSSNIMNSTNFSNNTTQDASPPVALTASSNSSGDSSTITCDGSLATSFPMNSSASYLIQSLFDDCDESQHQVQHHHQFINSSNNNNNYASLDSSSNEIISPNSWVNTSPNNNTTPTTLPSPQIPLLQGNNKLDEGMNLSSLINDQGQVFSGQYSPTTLSSIRASLLNSLQSRARGPSFNHKSHSSSTILTNKVNSEEHRRESKNNTSNNDQPSAKRPRIETPSPLPTFKVRKEKLGDRITALQQLVSPFGKTDTASVLHEAIEYIKFLHDQVNVLSTPYLKNGTAMQQKESDKLKDSNEESNQDLRSRGLCLVPISSTYPVAQETPVDFWTPTFGGTATFM